jgi:hypothetical protein
MLADPHWATGTLAAGGATSALSRVTNNDSNVVTVIEISDR